MVYATHMSESNKQPRILTFPNQLMTSEERRELYDVETYIIQVRLHVTQLITAIQSKQIAPEPNIVQNMRNLNAFLSRWDTPLDLTFLDER